MNVRVSKCLGTQRRLPRHPVQLILPSLPRPSDRLTWLRSSERRISSQGRHTVKAGGEPEGANSQRAP